MIFDTRKLFTCFYPLNSYKCLSCNRTAHEKIWEVDHLCGVHSGTVEDTLKICNRCKVGSFSALWAYFHKKCNINNNIVLQKRTKNKNVLQDMFECEKCDYKTCYKSNLQKHKSKIHASNKLQCLSRRNKFQLKTLNKPNSKLQIKEKRFQKQYQCADCDYIIKCKRYLRIHKLNVHDRDLYRIWYHCNECVFQSDEAEFVRKHNCSSYDPITLSCLKNEEIQCDKCEFKTDLKSKLNLHNSRKHVSNKIQTWFYCEKCGFECLDRLNLKSHLNKEHALLAYATQYQCDECVHITTDKNYLEVHKLKKHSSISFQIWYHCKQCVFKCRESRFFKSHKCGIYMPLTVYIASMLK